MVVLGTNAGAVVPAALDHMRLGTSGAVLSSPCWRGLLGLAAELDQLELRQHQAADLGQVVGIALVGGSFWPAAWLPPAADHWLEARIA